MIPWLEDTVTTTWQLPIPAGDANYEVYLQAISWTARFMVYEIRRYNVFSSYSYLFHCQRNIEQLQPLDVEYGNKMLYFTQNEQYLLGICCVGMPVE